MYNNSSSALLPYVELMKPLELRRVQALLLFLKELKYKN